MVTLWLKLVIFGVSGIIWRMCGSKCQGEGGGIFPTLCVECCLVFFIKWYFRYRIMYLHWKTCSCVRVLAVPAWTPGGTSQGQGCCPHPPVALHIVAVCHLCCVPLCGSDFHDSTIERCWIPIFGGQGVSKGRTTKVSRQRLSVYLENHTQIIGAKGCELLQYHLIKISSLSRIRDRTELTEADWCI